MGRRVVGADAVAGAVGVHTPRRADHDPAAAGHVDRRPRARAAPHLAVDDDLRVSGVVDQDGAARRTGVHLARLADEQRAPAREMDRRVRPARHRAVHRDELLPQGRVLRQVEGFAPVRFLPDRAHARIGDVDAGHAPGDGRARGHGDVDDAVAVMGRRVVGADAVAAGAYRTFVHGDADVAHVEAVEEAAHRRLPGAGEARGGVVERGVQPGIRHHRPQHRLLLLREMLPQDVAQEASAVGAVRRQMRDDLGVGVGAVVVRVDGGDIRNRPAIGCQLGPERGEDGRRPRLRRRVGPGGEQRVLRRLVRERARVVPLRHFLRHVPPGQGMSLDARSRPYQPAAPCRKSQSSGRRHWRPAWRCAWRCQWSRAGPRRR